MNILGRKWSRTCLCILLVVVCLGTSFVYIGINANAKTVIRTGTVVVSSSLNFRKGPGTEYDVIGILKNGDTGDPSSDEVLGKFRRFKFLDFQNLIPHNHKTLCFQ